MQEKSAIDKLGRDRKLDMLFTSMPFGPLASEIVNHEHRFDDHNTGMIPCRVSHPEKGPLQADDTPLYVALSEVHKVVMWLTGVVQAEQIGQVTVARLNPGGHVAPQQDTGPYHDHYDRFHLCAGGQGCLFRCDRETVKMMPGEVWWFHNHDEHEIWNESDTPCDHVIVDLKLRGDKRVLRTGGDAGGVSDADIGEPGEPAQAGAPVREL